MRTATSTLAAAMNVLARDIQSEDGIANAAIAEAAERLIEQHRRIADLQSAERTFQENDKRRRDLLAEWLEFSSDIEAESDERKEWSASLRVRTLREIPA